MTHMQRRAEEGDAVLSSPVGKDAVFDRTPPCRTEGKKHMLSVRLYGNTDQKS